MWERAALAGWDRSFAECNELIDGDVLVRLNSSDRTQAVVTGLQRDLIPL